MDDLKLIKKHYGEKMMHLCRELFPTLLETEGLLFKTLSSTFAYSRVIGEELAKKKNRTSFKNIILKASNLSKDELIDTNKTVEELLSIAGYDFYECHTEEDIQSFRKYYKRGETLCTFNGGRLNRCHVFFAVKKNVDEIKREDFEKPEREDEYGTSVISIQFSRGETNTLSIKNRYNHHVLNPDATYSNNLENIITGLTKAFEKQYRLHINQNRKNTRLQDFVLANDGKHYYSYFEEHNVYYCPDNIIVDNFEPRKLDPSRYLLMDQYILDMQEKKLSFHSYDRFISGNNLEKIHQNINSIRIENNKEDNTKDVIIDDTTVITLNNKNQIITYKNPEITEISNGWFFIANTSALRKIDLPNIKKIGYYFLARCKGDIEINLPKVETIGDGFLANANVTKIDLPNCKEIGNRFLENSKDIKEINLPNVEIINDCFLEKLEIEKLSLPNCKKIGNAFLNKGHIEYLDLPKVETIGSGFLEMAEGPATINLPKCKRVGNRFAACSSYIHFIYLPMVETIDNQFFFSADGQVTVHLPRVEEIGNNFMSDNHQLSEIDLPNCKEIGKNFLKSNRILKSINLPNCITIEGNFLYSNIGLESLDLPKCKKLTSGFLKKNNSLKYLSIPSCLAIEKYVLDSCGTIETLDYSPPLRGRLNCFRFYSKYKNHQRIEKYKVIIKKINEG